MYYFEGISQLEISRQLGISHPTVCRLIKQAREKGIVRVQIVSPLEEEDNTALERELEKRFALQEAVVVPDSIDGPEAQKAEVGAAAGEYLDRILEKNSVVGISMGTTLYAMARALPQHTNSRGVFVPLLGGVGQNRPEVQPNDLAGYLARAFGGEVVYIHAPAYVGNPSVRQLLMDEPDFQNVTAYYDKLDICLTGIGVPTPDSAIVSTGYFPPQKLKELFENGVVGDICLQFFDIRGNNAYSVNENIVGIRPDRLKRVKRSIGLATGVSKAEAAIGAMNGGFVNVLITHRAVAESILQHAPV
ncbi:sugar-binding transcriptional regulator [Christensenellaceae bacterium OttesenSCG-928-L17]|nr:sugar-binding transcriptional regulator [Christensenellaceae bacterium OttesenSCG-928-L17]